MNLTGVFRFTAACVESQLAKVLLAGFCSYALLVGADCDSGLSSPARVARFKQLDGEGEKAMHQHRPVDAVRLYQEAVCLAPNSARGYYGLGVAEAAAGDFLKARESLRTADRLQPTTGMPLAMQARVNVSLGDMETLKANLREAAARFPHDVQLHTILARFLAEHNLYMLALAEALRSVQDSSDLNLQVQLAVLENTVGAYDDAIQNALAVEQNHQVADQIRGAAAGVAGLSYESLHQPEQAARYLGEAIQLNPLQDNSYLALADLFDQEQKYADAVNVLRQAQAHSPDSNAILLALGTDLVRAERYKEGLETLHELLRKAPKTPDAYISIADGAHKTGDADQEVAALRQLEHYSPDYPMIRVLIARAMLNQAIPRYQDVLDELSAAAKITPNDPENYFLQGKVYIALGRYDQAITAFRRSVELRPTEPGTYYQLAKVYQKLGRNDLAREQFERVKYLEGTANK